MTLKDEPKESVIKAKVSKLLSSYEDGVWYFMPVQTGYGTTVIDYIGCAWGKFFAIETKRPGKEPTVRQEQTMAGMFRAGGAVFVVSDQSELDTFHAWLKQARK